MFVLRLRLYLPLLAATMLLGSVAALAWAILAPCRVEVEAARIQPTAEKRPAGKSKASLQWEDFEPLLAVRLQAPLFDPPPPKPPPMAKKELPPLPVKLLATMPEPDGGCAMFSDAGGATLVKSQGDQFSSGGAMLELVKIANDHVVLRQEDRLVTLKLPK